MTPNDRFALELGRAIVRALIAEARVEQLEDELAALKAEYVEKAKPK